MRRRSVLTLAAAGLAAPSALLPVPDGSPGGPRVRRSLAELQRDYAGGRKKPLEDLMRAWKGVKELPAGDPRSFFVLGGYHGEPFRGPGWDDSAYWGGYCQHGNVLFPVWHRIYLHKVELALRTIPGCAQVTLPFWDECDADSRANGIPWALTDETFELDGQTIPNPLRSYSLPVHIIDHIARAKPTYSKPAGYETVRYPYSGLVGTPENRAATAAHNARWTYPQAVTALNANVVAWLNQEITVRGKRVSAGVCQAYADCLEAPNYTVFSNTTSATYWNAHAPKTARLVTPLEGPHNKVHLAIGGFDYPGVKDDSIIAGANGDMGENDTAGLDPIFFFHHCFVDRLFWLWQRRHRATDDLTVIDGYPGTNSVDAQGPTPGLTADASLSMDTPLAPFALVEDGQSRPYRGRDAFNIERQLGYTYGSGSLDDQPPAAPAGTDGQPRLHVSGIDRASIGGSFLITAFADIDGERTPIGSEAVLSRWHVDGCANCQTHLLAGASFPLPGLRAGELGDAIRVEVRSHAGTARAEETQPHFRLEVR